MPPSVEDRFRYVLEAIDDIDEMLAGVSLEQFTNSKLLRKATERNLEIMCEAARHFRDKVKQSAPGIDWFKMNDFANLLRHAYYSTKVDIVWDIVHSHVPPLKSFVELQIRASGK